jgi:hypothetical protein
MDLEYITSQVKDNTNQIIEIRLQLSTLNLVKTIVFMGSGMILTSIFGGMIFAGAYAFISK